jgi:glycosyltransferase involved in cell wall biosynthesis
MGTLKRFINKWGGMHGIRSSLTRKKIRRAQQFAGAKPIESSTKAVIRRELPALAQIEPDLMSDSRLFDGLDALPFTLSMPCNAVVERWRQLWVQFGANTKHLVFVPWLVRGGADLAAVNVVKALQRRSGMDSVVIVATDYADAPAADWLPDGTRFVRMMDTKTSLSLNETKMFVERLIWALRPESVFNVNSRACWEAMAQTGRPLSRMTRLNALLFCRDYSADGRAAGYSDTHFRAALPHLHRVYFDTRYFIQELTTQYGLPSDLGAKLRYLPQPSLGTPTTRSARCDTKRPRVLWAGRFTAQKNTELLMKIAYEGTAFDFDIWGSGLPEIEAQLRQLAAQRPNIRLRGTFASLDELPLNEYMAFLFTSHYEGMPTIILNIAASGLPIVATTVGGVGEIVDDETGWPVADRHDPQPYLAALAHVATGTAVVRQKVEHLFKRLRQERSLEAFEQALSK